MAIKKDIIASNGVPLNYHRVVMVKIDSNQQVTILIESYVDESGRQYEKDYASGKIDGNPIFPYVSSVYVTMPYDPDMTIEKAYRAIKGLSEFEGAEDAFDEWSGEEIEYKLGLYLMYNDKVYKVIQPHTSKPEWTPDVATSLYAAVPDPRVDYAPFVQPTGPHDAYMTGDTTTFNGRKYRSRIDNNVWSPEQYPGGWEEVTDGVEIPEWVQPSGAHDAYSEGDRVRRNGKVYESTMGNNVWDPETYPDGWKLVTEEVSA